MIPIVLSALLSSAIGNPSSQPPSTEIRTHAASLLQYILTEYSGSYPTLRPRLLRTLLRGLVEENKSIGTRFGAVIALSGMGKEAVLSTLGKLGNLKVLSESLRGDAPEVGQILQAVVVRYFFWFGAVTVN